MRDSSCSRHGQLPCDAPRMARPMAHRLIPAPVPAPLPVGTGSLPLLILGLRGRRCSKSQVDGDWHDEEQHGLNRPCHIAGQIAPELRAIVPRPGRRPARNGCLRDEICDREHSIPEEGNRVQCQSGRVEVRREQLLAGVVTQGRSRRVRLFRLLALAPTAPVMEHSSKIPTTLRRARRMAQQQTD